MTTMNSPSAPRKSKLLTGGRRHHLHESMLQRAVREAGRNPADRLVVLHTPAPPPLAGSQTAEIDCRRPQPIRVRSTPLPRGRSLCRHGDILKTRGRAHRNRLQDPAALKEIDRSV